jgi:hypothetical protein
VDFARKLHVDLTPQRTMRVTFVDRIVDVQVRDCQITLLSQDEKQDFVVSARAIENLAGHAVLWPWNRYLHRHPHLADIKVPKSPASCKGTILIGTDNVELLQALEYRRTNRSNRPMGLRTTLGWAFMGPDPEGKESLPSDKRIRVVPALKTSGLEKLLQRQFDIENLGTLEEEPSPFPSSNQGPKDPGKWSPDERLADTMMSVKPVSDNGLTFFEGKIPWKRGHHSRLQENARAVRLRQDTTHAPDKLRKKGVDISEIDAIIGGYLEKGYIEPVPKSEEDQGWYLPFFEVVNRQKSTPIRLVFDAKAKYRGTSLNNQILDTPNRLNDLTIVLTRMRLYRYVLAGDITEMFLQIRLNPEDKQYHRFTHGGAHYQWTRTLFGNKSSPNMSQKVLDVLCSRESGFAEAKKTVTRSCYMDDCIDSRDTEEEVVALAKQLPVFLKKAGMKICKLYSNNPEALRAIDPSLRAKGVELDDKDVVYDEQKVLGLTYKADQDSLTYAIKYQTVEEWKKALRVKIWTRRSVLSVISSHYDPLGLAAPLTVAPRRLLQTICTTVKDWDDPLAEDVQIAWELALENLLQMSKLSFPRWLGLVNDLPGEFHIYCDASEETYACAVYLRTVTPEGVKIQLMGARARVTPIISQSVSRSELDACVLGTRMATHFKRAYQPSKVCFYTDAKNALFWITALPKKLKVFVQRRVAEIQRSSEKEQWGYVHTSENPADIPTRTITADELSLSELWTRGPGYLSDPDYEFAPFRTNEEDPRRNSWKNSGRRHFL